MAAKYTIRPAATAHLVTGGGGTVLFIDARVIVVLFLAG